MSPLEIYVDWNSTVRTSEDLMLHEAKFDAGSGSSFHLSVDIVPLLFPGYLGVVKIINARVGSVKDICGWAILLMKRARASMFLWIAST